MMINTAEPIMPIIINNIPLHPINDKEYIYKALLKISSQITIPAFNTGVPIADYKNYDPADSLGQVIHRNRYDSLGSGLYVTSNIQDVWEWRQRNIECKNKNSQTQTISLIDLSQCKNMLCFDSDDDIDDFAVFLDDLSLYVLKDIKGLSEEFYNKINRRAKVNNVDAFCDIYSDVINKYDITGEAVNEWKSETLNSLTGYLKDNGYNIDSLYHTENLSSKFIKEVMQKDGIDIHTTLFGDSVSLGSVIYNPDSAAVFVDFGNNIQYAKDFYSMSYEKILYPKLFNIKDDEDLQTLVSSHIECFSSPKQCESLRSELTQKKKEIEIQGLNPTRQSILDAWNQSSGGAKSRMQFLSNNIGRL